MRQVQVLPPCRRDLDPGEVEDSRYELRIRVKMYLICAFESIAKDQQLFLRDFTTLVSRGVNELVPEVLISVTP